MWGGFGDGSVQPGAPRVAGGPCFSRGEKVALATGLWSLGPRSELQQSGRTDSLATLGLDQQGWGACGAGHQEREAP